MFPNLMSNINWIPWKWFFTTIYMSSSNTFTSTILIPDVTSLRKKKNLCWVILMKHRTNLKITEWSIWKSWSREGIVPAAQNAWHFRINKNQSLRGYLFFGSSVHTSYQELYNSTLERPSASQRSFFPITSETS